MKRLFTSALRAGEGRTLKQLANLAQKVNSAEQRYQNLTDDQLQETSAQLREQVTQGTPTSEIIVDAFALVREASVRVLSMRPYDEQIMGAGALAQGMIAEMRTGEGKTLVAAMPAYLAALEGRGVHVVTVNDYLARRDAEHIGRIHTFLGLTVGIITSNTPATSRAEEYAKDITYITNNELGFDYLRDNMATSTRKQVQRGLHFAIVDEIDSILIDEARTPLIISGPASSDTEWYPVFAELARELKENTHYLIDRKRRTVSVTEEAASVVEKRLDLTNLYDAQNLSLVGYLNNAIKAKELFTKDRDYVITSDGECAIVDEHTGRVLAGRRYNDGLHQAIEAKENVQIKDENQTLASVTLQNLFRQYTTLSGMTGTAQTEAAEFTDTYNLGVVTIPTHKPMIREDLPDRIYRNEQAKLKALVDDVQTRHEKGQPVLVGTASVASSERVAELLATRGIKANVLNAKNHHKEASIIAQAGRHARVTVATNMAGRGTDIMLGGNPEQIAYDKVEAAGIDALETPEEYAAAYDAALEAARRETEQDKERVVAAGGLAVLGSERHESRRIDNQLRGRSGRQGDPGQSRFYLSLEDDLLTRFKAQNVDRILQRIGVDDDSPLEAGMVTKVVAKAQSHVESFHQHTRKELVKYDNVTNKQRLAIYSERQALLEGADVDNVVEEFTGAVIDETLAKHASEQWPESWNLNACVEEISTYWPTRLGVEDLLDGRDQADITREDLRAAWENEMQNLLENYRSQLGDNNYSQLVRQACGQTIDAQWQNHLLNMDYLRSGISMRAIAQQDPLVEYTREALAMFNDMSQRIRTHTVRALHTLCATKLRSQAEREQAREAARTRAQEQKETHNTHPDTTTNSDNSNTFAPAAATPRALNLSADSDAAQRAKARQSRRQARRA